MIIKSPIVRDADDVNNKPALVADLKVRGVWKPQIDTLFDVRVVDADALSYEHCPFSNQSKEEEIYRPASLDAPHSRHW